jgi:hypothetical protein
VRVVTAEDVVIAGDVDVCGSAYTRQAHPDRSAGGSGKSRGGREDERGAGRRESVGSERGSDDAPDSIPSAPSRIACLKLMRVFSGY